MPKWGLTMSEALVVRWLCDEGDEVTKDQPLVEVETEKANAEVPSPVDGVLGRIVAIPGTVVPVGEPLAVLSTNPAGVSALDLRLAAGTVATALADSTELGDAPTQVYPGLPESGLGRASPLARRLAKDLGVDITTIAGTGANGTIVERDVLAVADQPVRAELRSGPEPLSPMRRAIGSAMSRSLAEAPQLTLIREVGVEGARSALEATTGASSFTDLVIAAVARALRLHPHLNAHFTQDGIELFDTVELGLAVALDDGLVVPVIRRADLLTLAEITDERKRLVTAALGGHLRQAEIEGASFTVTNLGPQGIDAFTPILNPPQVAMLGVGAIKRVPIVIADAIVPSEVCVLSLTIDHRAVDGAPGAAFLATLAGLLDGSTLPTVEPA